MDHPVNLLGVIAGAAAPGEGPEPEGTIQERFAVLADAVVKFERAYDKTYEGADPSTQRRLKRLRTSSSKAATAAAELLAAVTPMSDKAVDAFIVEVRPDAQAAMAKLGVTFAEGDAS
jgi:hypothetical protein